MADFIRLRGDLPAINMDHVIEIEEGTTAGSVALTMDDGRVKILAGDEAQRLIVWLRNHAGLAMISGHQSASGNAFSTEARRLNQMTQEEAGVGNESE